MFRSLCQSWQNISIQYNTIQYNTIQYNTKELDPERMDTPASTTWALGGIAFKLSMFSRPLVSCDKGLRTDLQPGSRCWSVHVFSIKHSDTTALGIVHIYYSSLLHTGDGLQLLCQHGNFAFMLFVYICCCTVHGSIPWLDKIAPLILAQYAANLCFAL